ncbi:uncharacterized protein LOC114277983 [Camellia sinensis]|nr:uncharacterized protein LOC114277983 [Camellia sinensis]
MANLKGINADQSVVNDASRVDLPDDDQAQRKKRVKRNWKKKRELFDSSVTSLGSIKEVASSSLLVVQEAYVSACGCSDKMKGVGEVVAERGTLKGINTDQSVVNDASRVDLPDDDQAQRKKRVKRNWKKKRELFDSSVTSLGSIKEVASSSLLVVQEAYVSACGCSDKMKGVGEVVAERGTLKGINTDQSVVNDASRVDLPDDDQAQRKKRVKRNWKKKRELFDSSVTSLGSIKEVASSSLLVVQEAYVSACGCSDKMKGVGEVVAERGTLKGINTDQSVVNDASRVDLPDDDQAQRKKRVKRNWKKKRELFDSSVTSLGSIASPSLLVVQEASASASASGCSDKMMGVGEVVAEHSTSLLVTTGGISLDKASDECPDSKPASGEHEKKVELENLKRINNEQCVVNDASRVDLREFFCEHGNGDKDKPHVIHSAVLDDDQATKPNQRKKQNRREKRKLSDSSVTSLVSIKEVAPPSLLVVQDSSVRETSLNHSHEAYASGCSDEIMRVGEVVAERGTLKGINTDQSVVNDASRVDLPDDDQAQRKKRVRRNRRKRRKLFDSSVTSLGSINNVASPSLLVVQEASASASASASGCSDKMIGVRDVVAEHGTSLLVTTGGISLDKASGECPDCVPASGEQEKKVEMANLRAINADQSVVNNASRVDLPDDDQAQRKKRVKRNWKKKRELFDSSVTSLGSIASPSLLVVQEASASASASGCSDKMMGVGEVVAEHSTSLLVTTGGISLDKASGECLVCEPASGEQEKKVEMANLKGINADQSVVNDASRVDLPDDDQAQRKKRAKRNWRTKRKLFDSSVTSLGSIKEVASSSLLVVQEAYVSACGCSDKMKGVGEVVAERGTSLLVTTGGISLDKASDECPDSKPASGEHEKKVELENLKRINNEQCVVNDASRVDLREFFCEHGNGDKDKPHVIHSAVLDDDQATKPNQRKKQIKSNKRIRGKFSDSGVTSLGSIKEAASPSVLVVQDSSVRDTSLNHSDEAYASGCSEKMMGVGETVAEHGTSLLVRGHISLGKASGEFPDGEPASGEQERKVEVENNASWVDPQENFCEHANGDKEKPNVIQNAVLDDDRVQIDASFDVGSTKPCQRKKRVKSNKRKRGKFSDSGVTSLGSIVEAASPSVLVVQDSSVRDTSLNHSDKAYASCCSEKMMGVGDVVAEHGTSLLVRGHISLGKASGEFPDDEPASREQEKKVEMENLKVINNEQSVVNDASQVDLSEISFEHDKRDKDKPNVIQNAVLDVSAEEIFHKSTTFYKDDEASDDASGSDPSGSDPYVENLEYDNLGIQPKLKDAIPSSSQFGTMTDDDHDVSLAVIGKEGPRQRLQSSLRVPPDNLKKKLLVLDVNGLLADIFPYVSGRRKPDTVISQKAVFKRPFCDDFLQFCFERFCVGVWSSRTKKNVESVIGFLMGNFKHNLLFCWNQSHCTRTGFYTVENKEKPLVLKEIKKLWEKRDRNLPWKRGEYNESNTLLLDDSPYKALCNPPHTAIFPHSYQYKNVKDNSLGPGGDLRVYLEGLAMADNVRKYVELNPFGQRPITKTNLSWEYYLKVISSISSPKEEDAQ